MELVLMVCLRVHLTKCEEVYITHSAQTMMKQISCGGPIGYQDTIARWQEAHPDHIVVHHSCRRMGSGEMRT